MELEIEIPAWLSALIHAKYYKQRGKKETSLKYCCVDCASKSLTEIEKETEHQDHCVLEGFMTSWHCGYETNAIKKLYKDKNYDFISGVAAFHVNKIMVYFPKSRAGLYPYDKYKSKSNGCVICGWPLKEELIGCSYCSILCKLLHESRNYRPRFEALVRTLKEHEVGVVWPTKKVTKKKEKNVDCEKRRGLVIKLKVGAIDNGGEKSGDAVEKTKNKEKKKAKKQVKKKDHKCKKNQNEEKSVSLVVKSKLEVKCGGIEKPEIKGCNKSFHGFVGGKNMENNTVLGGKISLLKKMEMEEQKNLHDKAKRESKKRKSSVEITNSNEAADQNSDQKLQTLIYTLNNCHKLQGLRKRARKGIPYRAPLH